ncbi:restriction endonuclease [uncultured Desulfovibrio sp.]|uniref:restriction endonuclease n=1 Tax=uncultured Desulfovibrio sp. TaxID=167968 RepID=UPI0026048250|nr:restriction endonuclease [uncultured Desulfovibrio sp.]
MNTKQIGDSYEVFVHQVYQLLQKADNEDGIKNITIEKNKIITDRNGRDRQLDIFWEYTIFGHKYTTAIECKNYSSRVPIDKVESFVTKINSLNISKGIMVSPCGFQAGAESVAKDHGISLVCIRLPEDRDWEGRIKSINLHIYCIPSCIILQKTLSVKLDNEWARTNNFDKSRLPHSILNDRLFITNYDGEERISFKDLESKLPRGSGKIEHFHKEFSDSYLEFSDEIKMKITSLSFDYESPAKIESHDFIDFSPLMKAIVEYLDEEKKKIAVFSDGRTIPLE